MMPKTFFLLAILMLLGCGSRADKERNKDQDRPKQTAK
jgi:outer membrane biogenesis lipoprotein LolB